MGLINNLEIFSLARSRLAWFSRHRAEMVTLTPSYVDHLDLSSGYQQRYELPHVILLFKLVNQLSQPPQIL